MLSCWWRSVPESSPCCCSAQTNVAGLLSCPPVEGKGILLRHVAVTCDGTWSVSQDQSQPSFIKSEHDTTGEISVEGFQDTVLGCYVTSKRIQDRHMCCRGHGSKGQGSCPDCRTGYTCPVNSSWHQVQHAGLQIGACCFSRSVMERHLLRTHLNTLAIMNMTRLHARNASPLLASLVLCCLDACSCAACCGFCLCACQICDPLRGCWSAKLTYHCAQLCCLLCAFEKVERCCV